MSWWASAQLLPHPLPIHFPLPHQARSCTRSTYSCTQYAGSTHTYWRYPNRTLHLTRERHLTVATLLNVAHEARAPPAVSAHPHCRPAQERGEGEHCRQPHEGRRTQAYSLRHSLYRRAVRRRVARIAVAPSVRTHAVVRAPAAAAATARQRHRAIGAHPAGRAMALTMRAHAAAAAVTVAWHDSGAVVAREPRLAMAHAAVAARTAAPAAIGASAGRQYASAARVGRASAPGARTANS